MTWPSLDELIRLRPDSTVRFLGVPAGQRDLLHGMAGRRRVYQVTAADIHADVRISRETDDVARLKVAHRYRRQRAHLVVAHPRDGNSGGRPRLHHQAGAVEARVTRAGAAVDVRAADLGVGEVAGLPGCAADWRRLGIAATVTTTAAVTAAPATLGDDAPLNRGQLGEQCLFLTLQRLQLAQSLAHRS